MFTLNVVSVTVRCFADVGSCKLSFFVLGCVVAPLSCHLIFLHAGDKNVKFFQCVVFVFSLCSSWALVNECIVSFRCHA